MKTLLFILIPLTLLGQGTTHINVVSNQLGVEHFFMEDMSLEASYYDGTGLLTLNYNLLGTKDFSLQAKWGMNLNKNVTGGITLYYQAHPFVNLGTTVMRTFKERSCNTLGIGVSVDVFQVFKG